MSDSTMHSELSPSRRHRWVACPGSIREEAKYPEPPSSTAASDGTRTHTLLEQTINRRYHSHEGIIDPEFRVGEVVQDEYGSYTIDIERVKRVNVAMEYIHPLVNGFRPIAESRVYPDGFVGRADMSGTVDVQIPGKDVYEIIDYKDGMAPVEVVGNFQLEMYALGVLAAIPTEAYPKFIRATVIQPKLVTKGMQPITSWDIPVADLLARVPVIIAQAAATDAPDAPLVPGEDQCKYCRAKASCPALTGMVNTMFSTFTPYPHVSSAGPSLASAAANKDPDKMTGEELRKFLDAAPLVEGLLKAIKEEAKRRIEKGIPVPGYKMVRGRGSRDWALPEEEMVKKLTGMGIPKSAIYVQDLVSPAQAEKLSWEKGDEKKSLSKIQIERMNKEYVTMKTGAPTLAPESDHREAIVSDTSSLFSAITAVVPSFLAPPAEAAALPPWMR